MNKSVRGPISKPVGLLAIVGLTVLLLNLPHLFSHQDPRVLPKIKPATKTLGMPARAVLSLNNPMKKTVPIGYGYDLVIVSKYSSHDPKDGTEGSIKVSGHGETRPLANVNDSDFAQMGAEGLNGYGDGNIYFGENWFAVYQWSAGGGSGSSTFDVYESTPSGPVLKKSLGDVGALQISQRGDIIEISGSTPEQGTKLACQACVKNATVTLKWTGRDIAYSSGNLDFWTIMQGAKPPEGAGGTGVAPNLTITERGVTKPASLSNHRFIIAFLALLLGPFVVRACIKKLNPRLLDTIQTLSPLKKTLIFLATVASICIVVSVGLLTWLVHDTYISSNSVVDSNGQRLVVNVPGSSKFEVEWMANNRWIGEDDVVDKLTATSLTPAKPSCVVRAKEESSLLGHPISAKDFWNLLNTNTCSIIVHNPCMHAYRFQNIVARSNPQSVTGTDMSAAVEVYSTSHRGDVINSCNNF